MDDFIRKRLTELADRAYQHGQYVYTDFLDQAWEDELFSMQQNLSYAGMILWGGYEGASRRIACFGREDELGYPADFPLTCLHIYPVAEKFAKEYSHRDYLGSLMGLGMERKMFGDIIVNKKEAYVFVLKSSAEFVIKNLASVGRNNVMVQEATFPEGLIKESIEEKHITVSSPRADGVISKTYNLSRNAALELFFKEYVTINGHTCTNNDKALSVGDVVSARGHGKFRVISLGGENKKGKHPMTIGVFK